MMDDYKIYLMASADITPQTVVPIGAVNAVVLCLDTSFDAKSSDKPNYISYFIKDGRWVCESDEANSQLKRVTLNELYEVEGPTADGILNIKLLKNRQIATDALQLGGFMPATLEGLPADVVEEVNQYSSVKERFSFARTNMGLFKITAPALLLDLVARGEQGKAEQLLKINRDLLTHIGTFTDLSGRTFHCTAFQYAYWALDSKYMCGMMLKCIPKGSTGDEIRADLLKQLVAVERGELSYTLRGKTITGEVHFNFEPLLTALQGYVTGYPGWTEERRKHHWCRGVGLAQRDLPMHVFHHYFNPDEAFHPTPLFNKESLVRTLKFYNWYSGRMEQLLEGNALNQGLGVLFGLLRGDHPQGALGLGAGGVWAPRQGARHDFQALSALCEARKDNCEQLKTQLEQKPDQKPEDSKCVMM